MHLVAETKKKTNSGSGEKQTDQSASTGSKASIGRPGMTVHCKH
jgi:hypothetical protein